MSNSIGKTFFISLWQILKAICKLVLLGIYGCAKIVETMAGFIVKITEKML